MGILAWEVGSSMVDSPDVRRVEDPMDNPPTLDRAVSSTAAPDNNSSKKRPHSPEETAAEENLAASALLNLLSSPSPRHKGHSWVGQPIKRQKVNPKSSKGASKSKRASPESKPAVPVAPALVVPSLSSGSALERVRREVAAAMDGQLVEEAKVMEAQQWLYHRVELVRGKYKGREAHVVGMTAKKYRVRVSGVEHQLEVKTMGGGVMMGHK